MKTFILCALLLCSTVAFVGGCKSPQAVAVNTITSINAAGVAAYDGYITSVLRGSVPTNGVANVSRQFNLFQSAASAALDMARGNSNAMAPANFTLELTNLKTSISKNSNQ